MPISGAARSVIELVPPPWSKAKGNGLLFPHSEAAGAISRRFAFA
jgi:hypothetical protein